MPNISNSDRKYGFREVLYNIITREFYTPIPGGGAFHELDISLDGDSGTTTTTADVALVSPDVLFNLGDPGGLQTQQDLNVYFAENIATKTSELENDAGFITSVDIPDVSGIAEVLAAGNTAEALQSMRFRLGAEAVPDPDNLNPDPILLDDGIGSAHRALASSWTAHVQGTGGMHSDANANYLVNYLLGENAEVLALAKVNANYGFSFYQSSTLTGISSIGVDLGSEGINVSGKFKVDHEGSVEAKEFIGDGSKLTGLPDPIIPGDGKITINNFDGAKVGEFTVNQEGPTVITLPEIEIPGALNPRGFIQVKNPAPANPEAGDLYVQHDESGIDVDGQNADDSFIGMAGDLVTEGELVVYGTDDLWHHGGHVGNTEEILQSDWTEENTASPAYIKNKPEQFPEAPTDGNVYVRNGQNTSWIRGLPYDIRTLPELP